MNVESSTPRSVGRPRRGGGAAEAPSTAVRRGGDRARRGGGRATGSSSRCDGGGARGVVPRVVGQACLVFQGQGFYRFNTAIVDIGVLVWRSKLVLLASSCPPAPQQRDMYLIPLG